MSFIDKIEADGTRFWHDADVDRMADIIDACVDKIDGLETKLSSQRDTITGLYEIAGSLQRRLNVVEAGGAQQIPELGISDREIKSFVAALDKCVSHIASGSNKNNGNGDGHE